MSTLQTFVNKVSVSHNGLTDRPAVLGVVLATVLSRRLPLPPTAVDNPDSFYVTECLPMVHDVLGELSNQCVLDAKLGARIARAYWEIRYHACHPGTLTGLNAKYGMVDTYVRAGNILSEADHAYINSLKTTTLICAGAAEELLQEHYPHYFNVQS